MLKKSFVLTLTLIIMLPFVVFAQTTESLSEVEVDLWPEFDRPSMLVIYRIKLPLQSAFPVDMDIRIPASAGVPNAVAARQTDGSLITLNFEQQTDGEWSHITFKATTPEIQLEYYDPDLTRDGSTRQYEYRWLGDYTVDNFLIQVQEPVNTREMLISPSLGGGTQASDGLIYYRSEVGSLTTGQTFAINIEYQKDDETLSVESMPVVASGPINESALGRMSTRSLLPWLLGAVGVILIVGGGWWYWQSGRGEMHPPKKRRVRRKPEDQRETSITEEGEHIYCHQCGKRAAASDRFCRACGTQLKRG